MKKLYILLFYLLPVFSIWPLNTFADSGEKGAETSMWETYRNTAKYIYRIILDPLKDKMRKTIVVYTEKGPVTITDSPLEESKVPTDVPEKLPEVYIEETIDDFLDQPKRPLKDRPVDNNAIPEGVLKDQP